VTEPASPTAYEPFTPFSAWPSAPRGDTWAEFQAELDRARAEATDQDVQAALDLALRSAALESGAIEGLYATSRGVTRTVALQGAMWEAELAKLGDDVRGHFEAQLAAFDMVLDAATKRSPITEVWLRNLHATSCAAQSTFQVWTAVGWQDQPFRHGAYKDSPNNVTQADGITHWYAPVSDVPAEMNRLISEIGSDEFAAAHPVLQAAYTHHALTAIHPFSDGNGRVARALASVFLYRAAGIPLVIFSDQQEPYWDALANADAGHPQDFITFIEDRALDTMALVTDRLRDVQSPLEGQAAALASLFQTHGGLTHAQVYAVGARLLQHVRNRIEFHFGEIASSLTPDVHAQFLPYSPSGPSHFWGQPYHLLVGNEEFRLMCHQPSLIETDLVPVVGVANDLANHFAFIVVDARHQECPLLKFRVSDLHPSMSAATEARIDGWVRQALSIALARLQHSYASTLAQLQAMHSNTQAG
jgi:Fic family protein